uniref:P4Hc domain-containing protein n=1 Tax=Angiostrongylus cantonensis TaxID=6313 RepID=A0A0K0DQH9_ANGCA
MMLFLKNQLRRECVNQIQLGRIIVFLFYFLNQVRFREAKGSHTERMAIYSKLHVSLHLQDLSSLEKLMTVFEMLVVLIPGSGVFQMTKPERGGATVFNNLGTAVFPSKYDALFWYNLMRSGEGDLRTRHAACPVLLGVKWVSNKWIHERGQEFTRPCGLDEDVQEYFVGDLTPRSRKSRK